MYEFIVLNFVDNICGLQPKRLHGYNCNRNQFGKTKRGSSLK